MPLTFPDDNGKYLDIKSSATESNLEETEEERLFTGTEPESRLPKDNTISCLPNKEREKLPSCSPSIKAAVHFDKPNRLVVL